MLAGDDEEGIADGDRIADGELFLLDLAEHATDRLGRLVDVEDLTLADAGRGDFRMARDLQLVADGGLADRQDRAGRADFKSGVDVH